MDFLWILVAFLCGFAVKLINLPPLIGYLIAGFVLNGCGVSPIASLETLANTGITLLLFTIGLKIRLKDLLVSEVLCGASAHMLIWTALLPLCLIPLGMVGIQAIGQSDFLVLTLIAFSLCFSSTVCIAKMLEEKGELKTRHGKIAIGVLVIQDIVAVIFLVAALGKLPSPWAFGLLLLFPAKRFLQKLIDASGHGELLPLVGFFLAFGAYELFSLVDLKGDLGALLMGMLLSSHHKSNELYKSLMNLKDIFLIGFFLQIGFTALPTLQTFGLALLLTALLPLKFVLHFSILALLKLRARTAFLTGLTLSNFSEFGLIVASLCVERGWLSSDWLVTIAMAVAFSFVISSWLFASAHSVFARHKNTFLTFQRAAASNHVSASLPEQAQVLIVGMGRVGSGSYDSLAQDIGDKVWGIDADSDRVEKQKDRRVILGDAEDIEFWENLPLKQIKLVMLALPSFEDMKNVITQLKLCHFDGRIAAISRHTDQGNELRAKGADIVFSYYTEVGAGFAKESRELLNQTI